MVTTLTKHYEARTCADLLARLDELENLPSNTPTMPPLFATEADRTAFNERHHREHIHQGTLEGAQGPHFLGIDAGSTTIKATLVNDDREIVWSSYATNEGSPLTAAVQIVKKIQAELPEGAWIARSCATGYGEGLITTGLHLDEGVVETMAHYRGAEMVSPGVTAVIDIGGQDMKYLAINDGVIDSIAVNEACSSGCGSFLQTFAISMGLTIQEFTQAALNSTHPVDLGSRCTVFMNSSVKQAQKEGASIEDIAAGLCYSVVRNALYKVIKLRDSGELGDTVVVQGGTFLNDAVLRAFELLTDREVTRPNIAGLMGAYGAALTARMHYADEAEDEDVDTTDTKEAVIAGVCHTASNILSGEELDNLSMTSERDVCKLCQNHCKLTITTFQDGSRYVTGNRCERGGDAKKKRSDRPNLYDYKYKRCFAYRRLTDKNATRGEIGIPRVLNMYENYPFWFTLLTSLGFKVMISGRSSHELFETGIESIASENICYPAKLVHGHIKWLLSKGVKTIFYPCVSYEENLVPNTDNHYNCPVVANYPVVIGANMPELREEGIRYMRPYFNMANHELMVDRIVEEFAWANVTREEAETAVKAAYAENEVFKHDVQMEGLKALAYMKEHDCRGIVLAGRPYHIDPEVNHGIPETICSLGMVVLSEDSICELQPGEKLNLSDFLAADEDDPRKKNADGFRHVEDRKVTKMPLRVTNQWAYHARLYSAANFVASYPGLELVQLNSFGCGLDAITTDQVGEILADKADVYTLLKIDEVSNLGAAKIRLRSLKAAIGERMQEKGSVAPILYPKAEFTPEMRGTFTILAPEMSPIHFPLIRDAVRSAGYNVEVLPPVRADIDTGLSFVNNDACYPAIITIGSLMRALLSGTYDLSRTAVILSQTGGACRASNYIGFLHKALDDAGLSRIPVISLNTRNLEPQSGFRLTFTLIRRLIKAAIYGDALQQCLYRTRPYEKSPGSAETLYRKWQDICCKSLIKGCSFHRFAQNISHLVKDFDRLPLNKMERRPRIGIVGEIYVKFSPIASNDIVRSIEANGGEAETSGMLDFFLYGLLDSHFQWKHLDGTFSDNLKDTFGRYLLEWYRRPLEKAVKISKRFHEITNITRLAKRAARFLSLGNRAGEGWFLTADMTDLLHHGCRGIICLQPFGCLPNHITGEGMIHKLHMAYPEAVFLPLDCDASASEANQENRLKLMMNSLTEKETHEKTLPFIRNTISARKGKVL